MVIAAISVGLALAFNATRQDSLPLVESRSSAPVAGASQQAENQTEAVAVPSDNVSMDPAQESVQDGEISLHDAALRHASGEAVFLDAREAEEYELGHIQGALSLSVFTFAQDFPALKAGLEGKTVITYCDGEHCKLSQDLADQLTAHGIRNVFVLKNGWSLWQNDGLPTATGREPGSQEPGSQEPGSQEPGSQEPGSQEPGMQAPPQQEPLPQEPPTQVPAQEEPASQDPATQPSPQQEPSTEDSLTQTSPQQEPLPTEPGMPAPEQKPLPNEPEAHEPAPTEPKQTGGQS
jgi:rhodanese-related sulfurtransferase